jgi:8-oxo-dGTP pyrophosphatase MutT (NUDIX family)
MSVIPVDASTVLLVRSCADTGTQDIEVLMVRRNRQSSFVPGYYVFPGGVVEEKDYEAAVERFVRGMDRVAASQVLADMRHPENALGAWVAGIRETFEEVGILLAQKKDGTPVSMRTEEEHRRFCDYREKLIKGELSFSEILEAENLLLPLDRLYYFSHWITPELLPLRYDVRFFVTPAPPDQLVRHDDVELTGHVWIRPEEALRQYRQGMMDMVLPQIMTLEDIRQFKTVSAIMNSARERFVSATLTEIREVNGKVVEVMPDGSGFEDRPPVYAWPEKND